VLTDYKHSKSGYELGKHGIFERLPYELMNAGLFTYSSG
jgi:hypothetical protein